MTNIQHKGVWFWHRYGRGLSLMAMLMAGIWMWVRAYSDIQNPNLLPLLCWAVFSSTLLWISHFGLIRFWEALLGFSAGIVFAASIGLIFTGVFVSIVSPILFETLCQKWIDRRIEKRLKTGQVEG